MAHISRPKCEQVDMCTHLVELLLQDMYLILHGIHLHTLKPTTACEGLGRSKVQGCICRVTVPAFVQSNHLQRKTDGSQEPRVSLSKESASKEVPT